MIDKHGEPVRENYRRQGEVRERERIIKLLEETFGTLGIEMRTGGYVFATDLATLIKGENK